MAEMFDRQTNVLWSYGEACGTSGCWTSQQILSDQEKNKREEMTLEIHGLAWSLI